MRFQGKLRWLFIFMFLLLPGRIFSQKQPIRTIIIKVAAEEGFSNWEIWQYNFISLVKDCSWSFKDRFGLDFVVREFVYWRPGSTKSSMPILLNDLINKVPQGKCDIVMGLISPQRASEQCLGFASYLDGYALMKCSGSFQSLKFTLIHEFCHLFGAVDLLEQGSIMSLENVWNTFDDFTTQIVFLNKWRTFVPPAYPLPTEKIDEAIFLCEKRAKKNLGEGMLHLELACLYQKKNEWKLALGEFEKSLLMNPGLYNVEGLLDAISFSQDSQFLAIQEYRTLLKLYRGFPETHFNLGLRLTKKGLIDEGLQEFRRTVEDNPRHAEAHAHLAYFLLEQGKIDEAIRESRMAIEVNPRCPEALCTLGAALIRKTQSEYTGLRNSIWIDEAADCFREAIALNFNIPEAHNNLGIALFYQGSEEEAKFEFIKALQSRPESFYVHFNLGVMYTERNLLNQAEFHFKKAIELNPQFGPGYYGLAKAYFCLGNTALSLDCLRIAEKLESGLNIPLIEHLQIAQKEGK